MEAEAVGAAEEGVGEVSVEDEVAAEVMVVAGLAQGEDITREAVVAAVMTSLRPSLFPATRWGW